MATKTSTQDDGGDGDLAFLLTIIFVVLKLTGVIDWSWIWVLCPLWIPPVAVLFIFASMFLVCGFIVIVGVVGGVIFAPFVFVIEMIRQYFSK